MIAKHFDIQFEAPEIRRSPWNDEWRMEYLYRKNIIENYPELIPNVTMTFPTEEEKEEIIRKRKSEIGKLHN